MDYTNSTVAFDEFDNQDFETEENGQAFFTVDQGLNVATSINPTASKPLVVSVATTAPVIVHPTFTDSTKTTLANTETKKETHATRKNKDPNAPSAPVSAYTMFFRDRSHSIKQQNPVIVLHV